MSTPGESRREHPSTYIVQDRSNEEELKRVRVQDQLITAAMGGVLSEQPDSSGLRRILDVGCGPGGWIFEAVRTYPDLSAFGIDISARMIRYAREQATVLAVSDHVEFHVMDALRMIEFPTNFFDLVNLRFGVSFLRKWDWPWLLSELQRVTRPGGIIRLTEADVIQPNSSPALMQYFEMVLCALFQAGHIFERDTTGLTAHLSPLLMQRGCQHVQTKAYALEFQPGSPGIEFYYDNIRYAFRTVRPFLRRWGCAPSDYDTICQQALEEMQQSNFHATWHLLTAWGENPEG